MAGFPDPARHLVIALECDRRGIHGDGNAQVIEDAREAPDAGARAVLVDRLGGEVAHLPGQRPGQLCHAAVAVTVARRKRRLRAFLVIQHQAEGDTGAAWPAHARNLTAIADVVAAWAGHVLVGQRHSRTAQP